MQGTCIIVCAGDLNVSHIATKPGDYVIAADGGCMYCSFLKLVPNLIVGDFDSISEEADAALKQLAEEEPEKVLRLSKEKDDTDTLYAVKEGLKRGYKRFEIYAGTGGRLEHTLANIQVLLYLKNNGAEGYLMDGSFMGLIAQNEEVVFKKQTKGSMSLFALEKCVKGVTIKGMKYPLNDYTVTNDFPIGISNEFTEEEGSVSVKEGSLFILIRWD